MKHVKVLEVEEFLISNEDDPWRDELKEDYIKSCRFVNVEPVFNRPGYYYDRKKKFAWYEDNEGNAYTTDDLNKHFIEQLRLLNVRILSKKETDAIWLLMKSRLCPDELRNHLYDSEHLKKLNRIFYDTLSQFQYSSPRQKLHYC